MKEFNLQEYLTNSSQKVMTRDGRKARIVCTDANNEFPVVALVTNDNKEVLIDCDCNGRFSPEETANFDLFFAPIKKEGWVNVENLYDGNTDILPFAGSIYQSKEEALKNKCNGNYITTTKIEWEE